MESQIEKIKNLNEIKNKLENELKSAQNELNDIKVKFENSTVFIHHSCKANSLLKEEKDSLDKILQDNALKLESLKKGYDELLEKNNNIEMLYNDTNAEKDLAYKKLDEIKNRAFRIASS